MTPTLTYLLKVMICSGLFISLYMLAFHKKVQYSICRAYLMATMALSVIIPAMNVPLYKGEPVEMLNDIQVNITRSSNNAMEETPTIATTDKVAELESVAETKPTATTTPATASKLKNVDWSQVVYWTIVAVMMIVIAKGLVSILKIRRKTVSKKLHNCHIIENESIGTPFTFFRTVYIGTNYSDSERQQILSHELSHAHHLHSVEKLAMSILRAMFWFNPFFWLAERRLEEVQEWQADNDAIGEGYEISNYQQTIFKQIFGCSPELASGMSNSFTKNRFLMMTRRFSNRCGLPMFFSVTLLMVLFFTFSCTQKEPVVEYEKNIIFTVDHFFDDNDGVEKRYHIASKNRFIFIEVFEDYSLKNRPNVYVAANGISAVRSIDSRQLRWVDENIPIFYDGKKISYSEFKNLETGSYKAVYYMKKMGNLSFVYVNNENVLPQFNDEIRIDTLSEQIPGHFIIGDFNCGEVFGCGGWTDSLKTNFIRIFSPYAELFLNGKPFDYNVWRKNVGRVSGVEVYRNAEARHRFGEQYKFVVDVKGSLGRHIMVERENGHTKFSINNKKHQADDFFAEKKDTNQYTYNDLKREIDFDNYYNSQMDANTTICFYRNSDDTKSVVDSITFKIYDDYSAANIVVIDQKTPETTKRMKGNQDKYGRTVQLKDFPIDFKGQNVSSVDKFHVTLNKGIHYLFRVTRDSDASGQITATLTDANGNEVPTTIREENQDKYVFIFSCEQTGTYHLNMFSKNGQETRGTCTLYYIPE